jgi:DNA-binding CsgD family transcriptional regulator
MNSQQRYSDKIKTLTKREREVAECAAEGQTNKQIADQLRLSPNTVNNHLFRIFEKLDVSKRIELLRLLMNEHNGQTSHATRSATPRNPIQFYLEAAEEGFAAAQFILGQAIPPSSLGRLKKIPPDADNAVIFSSRSLKPDDTIKGRAKH